MSRQLHTEISIDASPARVWATFTSLAHRPAWATFIQSVEGDLRLGARLRVRLKIQGRPQMRVQPRVVALEAGRLLAWRGQAGVPGLFTGVHRFEVRPLGGGTRFVHAERFSGLLVGVVLRILGDDLRQSFEAFNQALKVQAESISGPSPAA